MIERCLDIFKELPWQQGYYLVDILKQKGAILRIKKDNSILKHSVNKLIPIQYTYHDTNQTNKAREQKLR